MPDSRQADNVWLTREPLDTARLTSRVRSPRAGAVVLFVGTTRRVTAGRETAWLEYEGYSEMALKKMAELAAAARQRWPLEDAAIIHRLGRVEIGEASIAVAVAAPHRREAFEAAAWLMDEIKRVVPIWKCEHWADGTSQWVHPGLTAPAVPAAGSPSPEEAR